MKAKDKLHGFEILKAEYIRESDATLYTMEHMKTGARLCYFDRADTNMTFAIAFKTPPKDDTGVFHIIEHSVLCGSRKFPLKEPFVDLLKGSLNTFLNAMTYEDRTVYPFASRCERDFLNLADVYLDAVFHPRMLEHKNVFLGEGWHYEYDKEENRLSYSGVVYSEMCGVYSSPEDVGGMEMNRLIYDGTIYGYDSGGDPRAIPDLTYEDFSAAHRKYYHPSNSYIYLDGIINLDKTLSLIDSYLSEFERVKIESVINRYSVPKKREATVSYEIPEGEDESGRARVLLGYSYSDFNDTKATIATLILSDVLVGSNESFLKKRLLDAALCEDVNIYTSRAEKQSLSIEVKGVKTENIELVKVEIHKAIKELCEVGIEKEKLTAAANIIEFRQRERDFGAFPLGVANALSVYGVWTYGGEASEALTYEKQLAEIRAAIDSDYFEKLLLSITVDNPYSAVVIMLPDKNAVADFEAEMQIRLDKKLESCTKSELDAIIESEIELKKYQTSADSDEAKKTLPTLPLSEINPTAKTIPTKDEKTDGARVISHDMPVGGISYMALHFDASDLSFDELPYLSLLSSVLTNLPTKKGDPLSLKNRIKTNLGSFSVATSVVPNFSKRELTKPVISVSTSALDSKLEYLSSIVKEVLCESVFSDEEIVKIILTQAIRGLEEGLILDGESFALGRIAAMESGEGAAKEYLAGYEAYRALKDISKSISNGERLLPRLESLAKRLFVKERLSLAITGEHTERLRKDVLSVIPSGEAPAPKKILPLKKQNEGFAVPSRVAYAALGSFSEASPKMLGSLRVARSILSYEYLWNAVRIVGGAYGTGFVTRKNGDIGFYSYRDPSPSGAINAYRGAAEYLRDFARRDTDLTKFIIGAYGEYDILTTPRLAAGIETHNHLTGWTPDMEAELKNALLSVTNDDLLAVADLLEGVINDSSVCVFANRETLSKIADVNKNIREI